MLKFSVGYPVDAEIAAEFRAAVWEYRDRLCEVYFAPVGEASGRMPMGVGVSDPEHVARQLTSDLAKFHEWGMRLCLLLNANCYGAEALSQSLVERVGRIIDGLLARGELHAVTTTSPFLASVVKTRYPMLEVRASVNMRVGSVAGASYLADLFDGFYVQKELHRDVEAMAELRRWADERGKKLFMLANSGCLAHCSAQTFHDNLIAHEAQLVHIPGWPFQAAICRSHLADPAHAADLLRRPWVRPQDLSLYEPLVQHVKLATRMHVDPSRVIAAYCGETYRGDIDDLLEPGHATATTGTTIAAHRLPPDWGQVTSICRYRCHRCTYCPQVLSWLSPP